MNNSRANACNPWKCKQAVARTARWTQQSPEKWEDFCFIIFLIIIITSTYYILMRSVSLGDCLCKALHFMQTGDSSMRTGEAQHWEQTHTPIQQCCGLDVSAEAVVVEVQVAHQEIAWAHPESCWRSVSFEFCELQPRSQSVSWWAPPQPAC